MAFATGKYANGLCDICGQSFKYTSLRKNWKGFMVCNADYEPKEPQLEPQRIVQDGVALRNARVDRKEPLVVVVGYGGDSLFESVGMQPAPVSKSVKAVGFVGDVTVVTS